MKKESIILNVYPIIKNSLLLVSFDELKFPENTDFGSIKVLDNNGRELLFDLIDKEDYAQKLNYSNNISQNNIAIIANRSNIKYIRIFYSISKNPSKYAIPKKKIEMKNNSYLAISTKKISILFEKNGYSIEKIKINKNEYGPLQLVTSGGNLFLQKYMQDTNFSIISDSNIIKIIKISGTMKIFGNKCAKEGYLPIAITYYFWSSNGKNMIAKAEIEMEYDKAKDMDGNKVEFLNSLVWFRLDNIHKELSTNSFYSNKTDGGNITTLKHPYYACFKDKNAFFAMCPYLALPNDGIHMEKGKNFFGASWHSMSEPKRPYWQQIDKKEYTGKPQGYYPAHSLRAYWKIGMYFDTEKKNIDDIASIFSYQPKTRNIVHLSSEPVSNAYITRWKSNKKMAFNAITDDAKINDYLYRAKGKMPRWVQMAIATRTLGIGYHRFCYIGNRIFYLKEYPLLSTLLSTLFCFLGIGKPLRKRFQNKDLSYLLHTNTHPRIYRLDADAITSEIQSSERIWIGKWRNEIPLSHVFSYAAPYGIATEKGTMEKVAFSASKYIQWIREWPIPNAPLDFFLPAKLFWGVCIGEMFDKKNCTKVRQEFIRRYRSGCDYMIISGHVPEYDKECPKFVTGMFNFFQKYSDVWFASADDIIKYYKARETLAISRVKKQGSRFSIELENNLPNYFYTDITLMQHIRKKINKMQFTTDNKNYADVQYKPIGKNLIMYGIPSNAKRVVIS